MGIRLAIRQWGLKSAFFAMGAGVLLSASSAEAIQGIGVSPTNQEVDLVAGQTTDGQITVINDGTTDVVYKFVVDDYKVKDESYQGDFNSSGAAANVSPVTWFSVPSGNFTVKATEQTIIHYKIKVPKDATVGGHYAAVFVQTVPPPATGPTLINRVQKVGSIFYLSVGGDLKKAGNTAPLVASWLQTNSPIQAVMRITNTGNVHFAVEGEAHLTSIFGGNSRSVVLRGEVLPDTTRRFNLSLAANAPIGLYKVNVKATFLGADHNLTRWVLLVPMITLLIVGGTILLLVVLGVFGLVRRRKQRRQD